MNSRNGRHGDGLIFLLVPILFVAGLVLANWHNWGATLYGDYLRFVLRAERFYWVDGFYPLGYPVLLRMTNLATHDYLLAGKVLNLIGAASALFFCAKICAFQSQDAPILSGLLCQAVLVSVPAFFSCSFTEGTDMVCVGFLIPGLCCIIRSQCEKRGWAALSGLSMGLAYLVRYTALLFALSMAAWIVFSGRPWRQKASVLVCFVFCLLSAASVQLAFSAVETGNPFFNRHVENIYFGVYGGRDWVGNWGKWRDKGLLELLENDPHAFLRNLLRQLKLSYALTQPLLLFAALGTALTWNLRRGRMREGVAFILLLSLAFAAAMSAAFVSERLLLPVFPLLCVPIGVSLGLGIHLGSARLQKWESVNWRVLRLAMFGGLFATVLIRYGYEAARFDVPHIHQNKRISDALLRAGLRAPAEVLCSGTEFYFYRLPMLEPFTNFWWGTGSPPELRSRNTDLTLHELEVVLRRENFRFLIFDERQGLSNLPRLSSLLHSDTASPLLRPVHRETNPPRVAVYEVVGKTHE